MIKTLLYALSFITVTASAQSTAGITGIRDTSYNTGAEYTRLVKSYPDLKMVPEQPELAKAEHNITYCKAGTRELALDVFSPKSSGKKRKAIIIIHGGGWRSGNRRLHYPLAQKLASMGYVCFTPEYRLSTEALYPAAVYDLKAAVRWVRQHAREYGIDPNAIIASGHSAGGELAAFLGATSNDPAFEGEGCTREASSKVNAVIDIDGLLAFIHPESGEGDDSKRTSAATYWFGYSKTENPGLWKQASPLTHVGAGDPPILFINSAVDRMHAGREDYIRELNQHGIYSEVVLFKGSPHSFVLFNPWFDSTVAGIDAFIQRVFDAKAVGAASRLHFRERNLLFQEAIIRKNPGFCGRTRQLHSIFQG